MRFLKQIILILFLNICFTMPCFCKNKAIEANFIYDQILDAGNYDLEPYNHPAGSRELNLFGLMNKGQYNLNAVSAPNMKNLIYSEVYFYPDPRVTASAIYIIPLDTGLSKKEAILSVSTKDKLPQPIIETDYPKLYPFKFNTFTPIDWNKSSDKVLFKEKLGLHYDQIYLTKLYLYDLNNGKTYDLNLVRTKIIDYWTKKGVFLDDYKWDIKPLGFIKNDESKVAVHAYGYYQNKRKFLGVWAVDVTGQNAYLISSSKDVKLDISVNGECLRFVPGMDDLIRKQRQIDEKNRDKKMRREPIN